MKTSIKSLALFFALFLMLGASTMAASGDKFMSKAKDAVEKSSPDDWFARAQWASKCIERGINNDAVAEWLNKSLEIQENAYNLEIMGDYYAENKMPEKAIEFYIKSIKAEKVGDKGYNRQEVQKKIYSLKK